MNPFETYSGPGDAPEGCDPVVLPATTNPNCANDYNAYESEITDIWVSPAELQEDGTYLATALPGAWNYVQDLNATAGLRHLTVIGDKPIGEAKIVTLAKKWSKVVDRNHSLNIDVTDMSIENYEFIRTLQHGAKVFVWFKSYGDWIAGGVNGILVDTSTAGIVWGRGDGTLMTGQLVFFWSNKFDPPAEVANLGPAPLMAVRLPGTDAAPVVVEGKDVTGIEAGKTEIAESKSRQKSKEADAEKAA